MAKSDKELLTETYNKLTAEFPQAAFTIDKSRGFQLIGVRSAFVIERLNEVFGLVGYGWRFAHSDFSERTYKTGRGDGTEFLTEVVLQYNVGDGGTRPIRWINGEWWLDETSNGVWSEPIFGVGGNNVGKGIVPISDTKKGAVSSALSKAASRLGVGLAAYQGKLVVDGEQVVVKGESPIIEQLQDTEELLDQALKTLSRVDHEAFQGLRSHKTADQYFRDKVLAPMADYIKEHELTKFVGDYYKRILHNESLKGFEGMTMQEAAFLADMIVTIVNSEDEFGWEEALEVSDLWDEELSWADLYLSWIGSRKDGDEKE